MVVDGDSYWSISEAHLPSELGREPTSREIYERTEAAIAYNAPLLGYDDPNMLRPGDVVHVDAVTLSIAAPPAIVAVDVPVEAVPAAPAVVEAAPPVEAVPAAPAATPAASSAPRTASPVDDNVPVPVTSTPATAAEDVPAPPPVTVAPRTAAQVTSVDHEDMLSSRWLFGGVAVTSLGLVGAWQIVKQMRRRRRRWLGLPAAHEIGTAPSGRERAADLDVAMLRQFVDPSRAADTGACAVVLGDRPEIRFRVPAPPAPAGWELVGDGWRRDEQETWTPAPVLSPALVTIGHGTDELVSEVVLDLLSAGTVSVTGDRVAVERLMCSMLWELASAPLGDQIELRIVGLACAAAQHATNAGQLVTLNEAIAIAQGPHPAVGQVFLVDPFADETSTGNLRDLVEACDPGSGRAVVVAGPCEHPVEEISVPSEHRAMWDDLTLVPPQLPESVDLELGRMLESIEVGRRPASARSLAVTPDPAAEAVALRSTLTVVADSGHGDEPHGEDDSDDGVPVGASSSDERNDEDPAVVRDLVEVPSVVLSVCGREVAVPGGLGAAGGSGPVRVGCRWS